MKLILILTILVSVIAVFSFKTRALANAEQKNGNAYDFSFKSLVGHEPMPLSNYKGKVILVVNTASKCGFTKQYDGLQKLYDKYKDKGLVIIGVPSNNFGNQEPGDSGEIAKFCKINYGVNFPLASKENVKGKDSHPFYKWARDKMGMLAAPKWNFHKYLIDKNGNLVDYFYSKTAPDNKRLTGKIEELLAK